MGKQHCEDVGGASRRFLFVSLPAENRRFWLDGLGPTDSRTHGGAADLQRGGRGAALDGIRRKGRPSVLCRKKRPSGMRRIACRTADRSIMDLAQV